jgi:DNA mismatch repair protein MutS2
LIDEIGDGTDPDEGAAIAIATLEKLLESRASVIATTHYGRIKAFALERAGVANASMAFEDETSQPLFRLMQGVAGRSRGIETARRTGFDAERVARAQSIVGDETFRMESALARLEKSFLALEAEREALESERQRLSALSASAAEKEKAYTLTRNEATKRALREAEDMLTQTRREIEAIVRTLRERGADRQAIRDSRARVETLSREVKRHAPRVEASAAALESVAVGDRVSLSPGGRPAGTVVEVDRKEAIIDFGGKRIRARIGKMFPAVHERTLEHPAQPAISVQYEPVDDTELHVRRLQREEALDLVSKFLDRAVLSGVTEVRIVHGVGEGILSRAVRDALSRDPRVARFKFADPMQGGTGVTVVTLR